MRIYQPELTSNVDKIQAVIHEAVGNNYLFSS
jgi:hypothetical protein